MRFMSQSHNKHYGNIHYLSCYESYVKIERECQHWEVKTSSFTRTIAGIKCAKNTGFRRLKCLLYAKMLDTFNI